MTTTPTQMRFDRTPSALADMLRGALPVTRRRGEGLPELTATWRGHRVDADDLAASLRITGLPARATLPLLYPHTFGFRLAMAVLTSPAFPVPIWNVLQIRNHILAHRPIPVGATLDFETRVRALRVLAKGAEYDLHTRVDADGALAWESLVTFYARGRGFGAPQPESPLARAPSEWGDLRAEWTMSDDAHVRFGRFTGDYNGIHLFRWYVRRFGFDSPLYHPQRVLAACLARLDEADDDRPRRLDAWLKGPVPHGAHVRLHARASSAETTFALFAEQRRPAIIGRLGLTAAGL
jgi:acyl dehydratase